MTTTTNEDRAGRTTGRWQSAHDHATAGRLAATEYDRFRDVLAGLTPEQWTAPTRCVGWDVRAIAGHLLGMAEMAASVRESMRQNRLARARVEAGTAVDHLTGLTGLQVDEHAGLSTREVVDRFTAVAPKAARARARTPGLLRRRRLPMTDPFPGDDAWSFGYLFDTILTRDPWMHRVDITDAIGTDLLLTPDHDGVVVADVVTEWAARHGRGCVVELSGPAGGRWTFGDGREVVRLDAVEFCRRVSGRGPAEGLLATQVPF